MGTAKLFMGSAGSFAVAAFAWVAGLSEGQFFTLRAADEVCGAEISRSLTQHALPLTNVCTYTDGRTRDLVPAWVNPIVFAGLAACFVLFALGMRAAFRQAPEAAVTENS